MQLEIHVKYLNLNNMTLHFFLKKANSFWGRIENITTTPRLNIVKTIYVNLRLLPLKQALHLPIYIYGKVKLACLNGSVEIKAPIKKGMITLGRWDDKFFATRKCAELFLPKGSKIIFHGTTYIGIDYSIRMGEEGILEFGNMATLTSGVIIGVNKYVSIGEYSRIVWNTRIMDSDFHFTYNSETLEVYPNTKAIKIGAFNWIGNNTAINKGTVTSDYTIATSGSILNKNYIKLNNNINEPMLLAGSPAIIKSKGHKLLYSQRFEKKITEYYKGEPNQRYILPKDFIDDINSVKL